MERNYRGILRYITDEGTTKPFNGYLRFITLSDLWRTWVDPISLTTTIDTSVQLACETTKQIEVQEKTKQVQEQELTKRTGIDQA
jgi:hypothetical protein